MFWKKAGWLLEGILLCSTTFFFFFPVAASPALFFVHRLLLFFCVERVRLFYKRDDGSWAGHHAMYAWIPGPVFYFAWKSFLVSEKRHGIGVFLWSPVCFVLFCIICYFPYFLQSRKGSAIPNPSLNRNPMLAHPDSMRETNPNFTFSQIRQVAKPSLSKITPSCSTPRTPSSTHTCQSHHTSR